MLFEWDEAKAAENIRKHNISFNDAVHVFEDENRLEYYDNRHSDQEDRYYTIGMTNHIIFVVYTERGERIRMISARYATSRERRMYYDRDR